MAVHPMVDIKRKLWTSGDPEKLRSNSLEKEARVGD